MDVKEWGQRGKHSIVTSGNAGRVDEKKKFEWKICMEKAVLIDTALCALCELCRKFHIKWRVGENREINNKSSRLLIIALYQSNSSCTRTWRRRRRPKWQPRAGHVFDYNNVQSKRAHLSLRRGRQRVILLFF